MISSLGQRMTSWKNLIASADRCAEAGDLAMAEELLLGAYELGRSLLGDNHSDVLFILHKLAVICEQQGKVQLADEYRKEFDVMKSQYPLDS